jgi:hypothetical protein
LTLDLRLPDKDDIRGLPYFFLLATAGMLAGVLRRGRTLAVHVSWVPVLLGVWFAVVLTGVANPRYRFVFEPFAIIYAMLLPDTLVTVADACRRKPVKLL